MRKAQYITMVVYISGQVIGYSGQNSDVGQVSTFIDKEPKPFAVADLPCQGVGVSVVADVVCDLPSKHDLEKRW